MNIPDTTLKIRTLGCFSLSIDGRPVATVWPDETLKMFFCSLLSPLDLYFSWDRVCRSMWDVPVSRLLRQRLDEKIIRPLGTFLTTEFGYNPLRAGDDGIWINQQRIYIDTHEFYRTVLEGLRLSSLADNSAAFEKFTRANVLYTGSYLPGIPGKIIENARHDLEAMYRTVVLEAITTHPSIPATCRTSVIYNRHA